MRSRCYELKLRARNLRKNGHSIGGIEHRLGIPRSTLSGWFKDIKLTPQQKKKLFANWKNAIDKHLGA